MRVLLDADDVERGLRRMAGELAERTRGTERLILVGIRRGGVPLATRLAHWLEELEGRKVPVGTVDITFYRDDAATRLPSPRIGPSEIPLSIDGRHVVLVDDVLFTGRTVRAALDALLDYGRPSKVELAVLVDRGGRELPIQADYVVRSIEVSPLDRVDVITKDERLVAVVQSQSTPTTPPPTP
ncbi:MAG: bifunctional pyr operon transcriptional regulator/uracil phosphoribosyltransferase PyrR [Pseudomonadota bacterium]|nr:MAG: bifunctional pyr operon transcriptional regulator/uracil phosphoribosyltransferase PyrR [Pseudomonadota bacterium]